MWFTQFSLVLFHCNMFPQLSRNRAARQDMEHDTMNKNHALTIDFTQHSLNNHSPAITYYPGIERVDNT